MAVIGYARVSTEEQHLDAQLESLQNAGCEKIFQEKISSVVEKTQLNLMLDYIREGDLVVFSRLDRVARSTKELLALVDLLESKGVAFRVLNIPMLDTSTATGKLMLTILGAIAEFERSLMLERQKDGIRIARQKGLFVGRQPTARAKTEQVLDLLAKGRTKEATAKELNIGVASVYRIAREHRQAATVEVAV